MNVQSKGCFEGNHLFITAVQWLLPEYATDLCILLRESRSIFYLWNWLKGEGRVAKMVARWQSSEEPGQCLAISLSSSACSILLFCWFLSTVHYFRNVFFGAHIVWEFVVPAFCFVVCFWMVFSYCFEKVSYWDVEFGLFFFWAKRPTHVNLKQSRKRIIVFFLL